MICDRNIPAIVAIGFNRPLALKRLLYTIAKANYPADVSIPLVISIDKGDNSEVLDVAKDFVWQRGEKIVIEQVENLGLRRHVISCGDLTEKYKTVIILEDDLLVSPEFYHYTLEAVNYYQNSLEIAGISLYAYDFNEYAETKFVPLEDGYDNYFIQTASSWGQVWTRQQWQGFKQWYDAKPSADNSAKKYPQKLAEWSESSWKKYYIQYLIDSNKYYAYPRISLSTNSGDAGTNHGGGGNFQVPLVLGTKTYKFSNLQESVARYDSHYEIEAECLKRLNPQLPDLDFECDFYGTKAIANIDSEYLLSIKECSHSLISFSLSLVPQELNIVYDLPGNCFSLGKTKDFKQAKAANKITQLKYLHKNLGWKRYRSILQQTFVDLVTEKLNSFAIKKV